MKKHIKQDYQLSNYDSICHEERNRVLAP